MSDINETIDAHDATHGKYPRQAADAYKIYRILARGMDITNLSSETTGVICASVFMIATKLSRACNGNLLHADHWHDIAGYATLVERHLSDDLPDGLD